MGVNSSSNIARLKGLFRESTGLEVAGDTLDAIAGEVERYSRHVRMHPDLMRLLEGRGNGARLGSNSKYNPMRAVDPIHGTVSRGQVDKLCKNGRRESSERGQYVFGRAVKVVRTPNEKGPPPKYWETFRRSIKPLVWGPAYDVGKPWLSANPVIMEYGFAILGKMQEVVFGSPRMEDLAFVVHDELSRISAAGRLPVVKSKEEVCNSIRQFCKRIHLSRWRVTKQPYDRDLFFEDVADGKPFDPYVFEMMRLKDEFKGLRIDLERLEGGLVYFKKARSSGPNADQAAKALAGAAEVAGIKFGRISAAPYKAGGALLQFDSISHSLMLGATMLY